MPGAATPSVAGPGQIKRLSLPAWAIDHPHLVLSFYAGCVIAALWLVLSGAMPRRLMPYVESPIVGIVTEAPGASAQQVETYVSRPIEQALKSISGVRYTRSISLDGVSIVTLQFPYGSDVRRERDDVQSIASSVALDHRFSNQFVRSTRVIAVDPLNVPVLVLAMTGDQSRGWSPEELRQFAEVVVAPDLNKAPHVQSVEVFGGRRRELAVTVDRTRLVKTQLAIEDVVSGIDNANASSPAGIFIDGRNRADIHIDSSADSPDTVSNYVIGAKNGQAVTVKDVAVVSGSGAEQTSGYHFVDGVRSRRTAGLGAIEGLHNDAVEIAITGDPGAGSADVIEAVNARLGKIEAGFPGVKFKAAYDNSHFVNVLFANTIDELIVALLLCALAVLLFLGSRSAALIAVLTIPASMALAILCLAALGLSLNSSTLIGLLLSIGRLVDDSIIDVHAITSRLCAGVERGTATIEGIAQVRRPVAASTFVLVLALAPLLFCGGITQLMFTGLVYPLIVGLLASFLVSLTLTAVLCVRLLTPGATAGPAQFSRDNRDGSRPGSKDTRNERAGVLSAVLVALERLDESYEHVVKYLLGHRFSVLAASLCTIIVGSGFYHLIGSEMMPLADVGQAYAVLEMKPGASYAETAAATSAFERILLRHPEIERVSTEIGYEQGISSLTGYSMNRINTADMMITLCDKSKRNKDIWQVIDEIRDELPEVGYPVHCLQIKEMGADVMASSSAPVEILVTGPDEHILSALAQQVADIAQSEPGATQVSTSWAVDKPSYKLDIDSRHTANLGLSPTGIAEQVSYALTGAQTGSGYVSQSGTQYPITVRYRPDQRRTLADVRRTTVKSLTGHIVELGTICTIEKELTPDVIEHDGGQRSISVLAYYRKGGPSSMDLTMSILAKASRRLNFPPGYALEMRGDMTEMMDSFARLLKGLALAVLLVLLLLIAYFRGWLAPLQMVLSLPLELAGVFAGLFFAHQSFSSVSIMAIIVLTGMDVTTAILLIDAIARARRDVGPSRSSSGRAPVSPDHIDRENYVMERNRAVAQACRQRLRPILMTSSITITTMAPIAFFPPTGLDAYQPLGTVVVSGLLVGTLLSLFVIPVMHTAIDDLERLLEAVPRVMRRP